MGRQLTVALLITATVSFLSPVLRHAIAAPLQSLDNSGFNDSIKSLNAALTKLKKEKLIPGLAAGVVYKDQLIWSKGWGHADQNRTKPVTADTPFWIASVSKSFVATAVLQLHKKEGLELTALASATPGFTPTCEWLASTKIPFAKGLKCDAPMTIKHILAHQVNHPIGTQFLYNPIMYSRLSRHVEYTYGSGIDAAEGRHNYLAQSIDKYILEPAGMKRTMASMWDESKKEVYFDMADGFNIDHKARTKQRMPRPERHLAGGAGVVSTIKDLAKYDIAIRQKQIVDELTHKQLTHSIPFADGTASPYGYGWFFQTYQDHKLMWHSGWDEEAGFSALLLRVPEQQLTFIVLANSEGIWWGNPLDGAQVENSPFAQSFMQAFNLVE
jgi:CubicO group peptidase (beta-lactamase class C family)